MILSLPQLRMTRSSKNSRNHRTNISDPLQEVAVDQEARLLSRVRCEQPSHSMVLEFRALEMLAEFLGQNGGFDVLYHQTCLDIGILQAIDVIESVRIASNAVRWCPCISGVLVIPSLHQPLDVQAHDRCADKVDVYGLLFAVYELLMEVRGVVTQDIAWEEPLRIGVVDKNGILVVEANPVRYLFSPAVPMRHSPLFELQGFLGLHIVVKVVLTSFIIILALSFLRCGATGTHRIAVCWSR